MAIVSDVYTFLSGLSPAIVDYYESGEWIGATGWRMVRRSVNDSLGDQLVVITEDGGFEPETPSPSGIGDTSFSEPAFQVRIRGEAGDSDSAQAKAIAIYNELHGLLRTTMGSGTYERVKAQTPEPLFIGFDEKGRPEFTASFRALIV